MARELSEEPAELSFTRFEPTHELSARRDQVLELARQYGGTNVRVFGSVARGEDTEASDIDLLVDLAAGGDTLLRLAGLAEELSSLLACQVDVATVDLLRDEAREEALHGAVPL